MTTATAVLALLSTLGAPPPDVWEDAADDSSQTLNEMMHGEVQRGHTLTVQTFPDQDWIAIRVLARRSYEARVGGGTIPWEYTGALPNCLADCARFRVLDGGGVVVARGDGLGLPSVPAGAGSSTARWISDADALIYLVPFQQSNQSEGIYDVSFLDTTLDLPRFNNAGTQVTVVIVRNGSAQAADGQLDFYLPTGVHVHSEPFTVAGNGTFVFGTASVPALQGVGGSATLAHTAGYGGLVGKAVALEPATGFTFDTMMVPRPR